MLEPAICSKFVVSSFKGAGWKGGREIGDIGGGKVTMVVLVLEHRILETTVLGATL